MALRGPSARNDGEHGATAVYECAVALPPRACYAHFLKARLHWKCGNIAAAICRSGGSSAAQDGQCHPFNLIMIFCLQEGQSDEARSLAPTHQQSEFRSNVDQWLVDAAALASPDGDVESALSFSRSVRNLVDSEVHGSYFGCVLDQ